LSHGAPSIQTSTPTRRTARYDGLPPWLLSTILHMLAVIALGLVHISTTPGSNLQLLFVPAQNLPEADEPDISGLADLDVALTAKPISANLVDDAAFAHPSKMILTGIETDWQDPSGSENVPASLVPGLGDLSGLGEGTSSATTNGKSYASLFGLSGEGGRFVYVFDRSESMNSVFTLYSEGRLVSMITPLLSAKQELIRSLSSLSSTSEFQIVFYNDSPYIFGESRYNDQLFPATDEYKEHASTFVEQMRGQGFTNHLVALEVGVRLDPDVIFLLTDAEAKDDLHPSIVRRIAKYCQSRNIVINVVHFCNVQRSESTLVRLAQETGGEHIFVSLESLAESMIDPAAY
jgi:hypothetical protein